MADLKPIPSPPRNETNDYKDGQVVHRPDLFGGRRCRFMRDPRKNRDDAITQRIFPANGIERDVMRFKVRAGDHCSDDARANPLNPHLSPTRAMQVFEGGDNVRPFGRLVRMDTLLDIQPGLMTTAAWLVPVQHNSGPAPGGRWQPPMIAVELIVFDDVECLQLVVRFHDDPLTKTEGQTVVVGRVPIFRRKTTVAYEFVNSRGVGDGFARFLVGGSPVGEYHGPLGYAGHTGGYLAQGIYRSAWAADADLKFCQGEEMTVHFENTVEGLAA